VAKKKGRKRGNAHIDAFFAAKKRRGKGGGPMGEGKKESLGEAFAARP